VLEKDAGDDEAILSWKACIVASIDW
jgi:hypothetical protein